MRHFKAALTIAGLVGLSLAAPGRAQQVADVGIGSRVRLSLPSRADDRAIRGIVTGMSADVLQVRPDGDGTPLDIQLSSVERLEVSQGKTSRAWGAVQGFLIGGGVGLVVGLVMANSCGDTDFFCGDSVSYVTGGIAMFGGAGAGLGAIFSGGDRWVDVGADRVRLGIGGARGGRIALTTSISW